LQLHLKLALVPAGSSARPEDIAVEGLVVSQAREPLKLDLIRLSSPSLALEIVDDRGQSVHMLPPPTPGTPEYLLLAPDALYSISYRAFVPPATPPGAYRVRLRYGSMHSDWVGFRIERGSG
jgi:hypothetical protein